MNNESTHAPARGRVGSLDPLATTFAGLRIHDVSPTIDSDLPTFFSYDSPQVTPLATHAEKGVAANLLTMTEHTGSHVDAPFHFDVNGRSVDEVAIDALFLRPFRKFDLSAEDLQPGDLVSVEQLKAVEQENGFTLAEGHIAIIEVGWDRYLPGNERAQETSWWGRNQPGLSADACEYLTSAGVVAVAYDTAGCDVAVRDGQVSSGYGHTHAFLPNGILIVEGLRGLHRVPASGLFVALPLKIGNGTASPLRVMLLTE